MMNTTIHAAKRANQRAVPNLAYYLLTLYGESNSQKSGTTKLYLSKKYKSKAIKEVTELLQCLKNNKDYYFIEGDGVVITCGHLF